jgi:hypothetical protein
VLAVDAVISVQVEPPFVEYSSFTVGMFPSVDQVIGIASPTVKVWPPFGAATVTVPAIVKGTSEISVRAGLPVSVTRTFAAVVIASGIVQR